MAKFKDNGITQRMSIRKKFTLLFVVLIVIPLIILNVVIAYFNMDRVSTQYNTEKKYAFSDAASALAQDMNFAFNLANVVYNDYDVNSFLSSEYFSSKDYYDAYTQYSIRKMLDFYAAQSVNIPSPMIYTANPSAFGDTSNVLRLNNQITSQSWYKAYKESKQDIFLYFDSTSRYAYVIRNLNMNSSLGYENFVKINIDLDYVQSNLEAVAIPCFAYLYADNDDLIYSWDLGYAPLGDVSAFGALTADFSGDDALLVFNKSVNYYGNVKFIVAVKRPPLIDTEIIFTTVYTLLITLVMALIYMNSMEKNYISRVENLVSSIDINEYIAPSPDSKDAKRKTPKNNNELSIVETTMSKMSDEIHGLIKKAYDLDLAKNQAEIRRKQSELNALLSQINPHYLFNVLNAIRLKSLIKGETETAKIILYVSKILRQSLTWEKEIIPLSDELNFIQEYLFVEKYRFEDKLNYVINASPEVLSFDIPKMTLQPFVENACVHGIQNILENGTIYIDLFEENDKLIFKITNPISEPLGDFKKIITDYSNGDFSYETKSVGLKNTFARLRYYYDNIGFNIDESVEGQVTFKLTLDEHINQNRY